MTSTAAAPTATSTTDPAEVVRAFLRALEAKKLDEALALLTEDAVWINVSLPTVRGRRRIEYLLRPLEGASGFRVHFDNIAADGNVVLTERTDELSIGPVALRLWVYGRFEVVDGQIALWRDSFDWLDLTVGLVRGLAGAVLPSLNRPWPAEH
jgi:limonene-1,2-epoxide hydrolase